MRLRSKSTSILLKILNGLVKMFTKTPSEVAGEDGIDSDIDLKKGNKLSFSEGKNCEKKKNLFPWQLAMAYTYLNTTRTYFCSSNLESSSALCLEGPNPYIEV